MHLEAKIEWTQRSTWKPQLSMLGDTPGGHDQSRLEENLEVVDLKVIYLKAVNLDTVNLEAVNLEAVNLEAVDWEACAMEAETLFIG